MVSKDRLVKTLDNIASLEDEGVHLISIYLTSFIEKSSCQEDKKRKLLEIANVIKEESIGHRMAVMDMIEYVQGREHDEF
jgi:hypothetical protein